MRFMNDFFTIAGAEHTAGNIRATIQINPEHPVFSGHFPGLPVVPGVCMLQIVVETIENQLNKKLFVREAKNLKFVTVLNPEENKELSLAVTYAETDQGISVNASLFNGEVVFFKMVNVTLQRLP
jgi:3-hydroxyacyl-[acyl-carrier-protein] dehydratase